jgi:hypothetical protein
MIKGGENPGLTLETGQPFLVGCEDLGQDFDGDVTGKFCVLGFIDNTHAAAADLLGDAVLSGDKASFR